MRNIFKNIVITAFVIILASCGGSEGRKEKYLEQGISKFEAGDYDKARVSFKNVLQIDPKDVKGRFWIGKTMEKLKEWRKAAGYFNGALEIDPNHREATVRLGRIMLMARDDKSALEKAESLLAKNPQDADGLVIRAGVHSIRGDITNAQKDAEAALKLDPNNLDAIVLLASIYNQQNNEDKTLKILDQGIAAHKDNISLRALKANIYIKQKDADAAIDIFNQIITIEPEVLNHRVNLAKLLISLERTDQAKAVLAKAINEMSEDLEPKIAMVDFLQSTEGVEAAESKLQEMINIYPDEAKLKFKMATLNERNKQTEKAKAVYNKIISEDETSPDALRARNRIAMLLASEENIDGALKQLKIVLEENPRDNDALILRGNIAMVQKRPIDAIADYRSVLRDQPDSAKILSLLARAQVANDEIELAKQNYQRAIEADPMLKNAYPELAHLFITSNEHQLAIKTLEQGLMLDQKQLKMLDALTKLYMQTKQPEEAKNAAKRLQFNFPDSPLGYYYSGMIAMSEKQFAQAEIEFKQSLSISPTAVEPLNGLVRSFLYRQQHDLAIAWLDRVVEKNPKHAVAYNLLGEVQLGQKQHKKAKAAFEKAISVKDTWWIPYRGLAGTYLAMKQDKKALETYTKALEKDPKAIRIRTDKALLLEKFGKYEQAISEYETIMTQQESAVAANNLAMMLVRYRKDQKSIDQAYELVKIFENSSNPALIDTAGWVNYKKNNNEKAIELLEKAVDKAPQAAVFRYHLGMAYLKSNLKEMAKSNLQKSIDAGVKFAGLDEAKDALKKLN
ncbi:MAG: hypothetical protein D6B28_08975 [Gammaproteobacteria bacterium]|nr:MAG: hypothetical protein D6B28_08975 [Gammaproteobacteria bacterium]